MKSDLEQVCEAYRGPMCTADCRVSLQVDDVLFHGSYQVSWRHILGIDDRSGVVRARTAASLQHRLDHCCLAAHEGT